MRCLAIKTLAVLVFLGCVALSANAQDTVPGPFVNLKPDDVANAPTFTSNDKIMMTYYFYWYDVPTHGHILDADGTDALTTHPAQLEGTSYRSVAWHKRQLEDMMAAGIDVVLPVYWGAPSERDPKASMHWSFEGLKYMVQALDQLVAEGKTPPRVGLFYDTSTLQNNSAHFHADLTTEEGRRWFYESIRDFFSVIPPKHWAQIDGKPVVGLYAAAFAKAHNPELLGYVRERFAQDFAGKTPYVIREVSWNIPAENVYAWGGAIKPNVLGVAEIGPGYDHSAVPGRAPLVAPRENGEHYKRAWEKAIRAGARIILIETWNEWHEGTDIADSREYGRQYIDLTRLYADRWRSGWNPPPIQGPYTGASSVSIALGDPDTSGGLTRVTVQDGATTVASLEGRAARVVPARGYLYLAADESFKWARDMNAAVEVTYFDGPSGAFGLQYDSHDPTATLQGAYKTAVPARVALGGTNTWKTATFQLPDARLAGLQNAGADFRIAVDGPTDVTIAEVALRRAP